MVTTVPTTVVPAPGGGSRSRTPPVDATTDFAAVGPHPTLDALAAQIFAAIERRRPAEQGGRLSTSSSATATNSTGTVLMRRGGFADDSVAGEEYIVSVEEGPGGWTVVSATRSDICRRGVSGSTCI